MNLGVQKSRDALIDLFARYPTTCFLFVYFMASVLLTWPLVFNLSTTLFGDYGDSRGGVWLLWSGLNGMLDGQTNQMVAAPFGVPASYGYNQPIIEWIQKLFAIFSNEIVAYNLVIINALPLTAIATYLFIDSLLKNKSAAFFGGLVFGFCPGAVMQAAGGHAAFAFNAFIPLFMWALFFNRAKRSTLSAFFVAGSFSLITLTALYFGYMAIFVGLLFLLFDLLGRACESKAAILKNYGLVFLFAALLILPFEYQIIAQHFAWEKSALAKSGQIRDFNELIIYSSRPWDFFVPSIDHPVLGKYFENFVRTHLHGSNVPEQTLYLGVVPIFLMIAGIVLTIRGKIDGNFKVYFLFFSFGALWTYFLSQPALVELGGIQVPTMSWFAYKVAPMFRVYARFGMLTCFFVACAIAVILVYAHQRMNSKKYYLFTSLLLLVLTFEYRSIPANYALSVSPPPAAYQWLAQQPGDFTIAEYPMTPSDESAFYTYAFWQRIHKKKLVNGASRGNAMAWDFYNKVKDLEDPQAPSLLKSVGVKFVVVHGDMYQEGLIPLAIKKYFPESVSALRYKTGVAPTIPFNLKLVYASSTDLVFAWNEKVIKAGVR